MWRAGVDGSVGIDSISDVVASPWIGICWHKLSSMDPVVSPPFGGMSDGHPASEAVVSIL